MRYQITSIQLLRQMLSELNDDLALPWHTYPCLEWPRGRDTDGYGQLRAGIKIHRVAFEIAVRQLEDHECALHRCDNPPCFRPIHLFGGTNLENIKDCAAKGRKRKGISNPASKLVESDIPLIVSMRQSGQSLKQIAAKFPVTPENVSGICLRKIWRHVAIKGQ